MTIQALKALADTNIRQQTAANSVTTDIVTDIVDNLADEILDRGLTHVADTTALSTVSGANFKRVLVNGVGLFVYLSSGTANGTTIFAASGGGVWSLGLSIQQFTDAIAGIVPASGGGSTNFLRADGTWSAPPGGGGGSVTEQAIVDALKQRPTPNFSFPTNDGNAEFVVFSTGIFRPDGTFSHGVDISWTMLGSSDGHSSSFFKGAIGNAFNEFEVQFPNVKRVMVTLCGLDETFAKFILSNGPSSGLTESRFKVFVPKVAGVRLVGDGAGGWTKIGDGSLLDISTQQGDGSFHFNISSVDAAISSDIYDKIPIVYNGPNRYTIRQKFSALGIYNRGFFLEKPDGSGSLTTPPTSSDMVIMGLGIDSIQVNMKYWQNGHNNWMAGGLVNFWVFGMFEAWMVGGARSTTEIQLKWQAYPSATSYKLFRATNPAFTGETQIYSGTAFNFLDSGRTANTIYYYKLKAVVSGVDTDVTTWNSKTFAS